MAKFNMEALYRSFYEELRKKEMAEYNLKIVIAQIDNEERLKADRESRRLLKEKEKAERAANAKASKK
jgi:hypothetical protein